MKRPVLSCVVLLCLFVTLSVLGAYAQFADRAVVTGIVTDATGAAVPDAQVKILNQETGVTTQVGTNSAGNYSTPPLQIGLYTVEVQKEGFKAFSQTGIRLTGGQTWRQDVKLEVGAVTQSVEVMATATQINTENPTVTHTVSETYYRDMPAVMGADIRLAESLLQLQPGFVPMQPNGDAIFRGSQFTSRINGGQTMATANWFDGAEFGYAEGHQGTQESSVPYPSVQEMTVVENTFSAQYGHTSGGFITYTTKSGTEKFHGNIYDFYTTNKVDAANWFVGPQLKAQGLGSTLPLGQNNWGFALGGPVPKVAKTFWFFNLDGLDYHSTVNTGFVNVLPDSNVKAGDFSEFLDVNTVVAHDAKGRPIYKGEIFNPASTTTFNNVKIRNGYGFDPATGLPIAGQANIIPMATDPLVSPLALAVIPLIPRPDISVANNAAQNRNGFGGNSDDNNKINVRTWLMRFDHTFSSKLSISNTYYENIRPRTAHCGGPQGCTTSHNGQTDPQANSDYIGQGFFQRITNHFDHVQINYVIRPNLFNHATLAYDRWLMRGHMLSGGVGWNNKLGLGLPNQAIFNNAGFPQLNFNGPVGYTHYGTPWASDGADINNRYQFLDDVSWVTGKHTIKAGFEFRYMTFPQTGWAVNTGGNFDFNDNETAGYDANGALLNSGGTHTGNEFASFILGQVHHGNFSIPFKYMPKMRYSAPWVNDDIKLTKSLNVTVGLRFDWTSGLSEEFNRFSTFDPTAQNPIGHLGATVFDAKKAAGEASWSVGPRLGFAYALGDKTSIRGGYGIYYAGVQADSWDPYAVDGYQTNPTASNNTNGFLPAFYFGGPSGATSSGCTSAWATSNAIPCNFPAGKIKQPPQLFADVSNGGNPVGVYPKTYTMPRYQNWSLSVQRQLGSNMMLDVAYVGNHGTRLIDGRTSGGVYDNMNPGSVLSCGLGGLNATVTNGALANAATVLAGCPSIATLFANPATPFPYAGFNGSVAQAIRPWPQYQQINWRFFNYGQSRYNALQFAFEKRMSQGLQAKVAYTYSHLRNNGAETGLGAGGPPIQNPSDFKNLYTVSSDDVPQILSLGWVYQLPFGKGKKLAGGASGALEKVVGNWQISVIQTYQAGRPLSITMPNGDLSGTLFSNAKFPNKVGSGLSGHFSNPRTDVYLNPAGWADPGQGSFGDAPRQDENVRGFKYYNEDISIFKDTYFGEQKYVRFEADAGNAFNRVFFCPVGTNFTGGGFGTTGSQCNIPRRVQFGLQLFF